MASKSTIRRQRSSDKVVAAGRTHNDRVAAVFAAKYGEDVGQAVSLAIAAVVNELESKTEEMVRCDDAHEAELRDDPPVRERRDETSLDLHSVLVETREQLKSLCGPVYVTRLGFSGNTPDDLVEVLRLGTTVVGNLATVPVPDSLIPNYVVNPEDWRVPLTEKLENMKDIAGKVAQEEREAEATLMAKRNALKAYDRAFSDAANLVSTLLSIAGEKELASRVRPSTRRSGQTAEDAPNTNTATPPG